MATRLFAGGLHIYRGYLASQRPLKGQDATPYQFMIKPDKLRTLSWDVRPRDNILLSSTLGATQTPSPGRRSAPSGQGPSRAAAYFLYGPHTQALGRADNVWGDHLFTARFSAFCWYLCM